MLIQEQNMPNAAQYTPPTTLRMIWLIAWRQMDEAVRNRSTLMLAGFSVLFPLGIVLFSLGNIVNKTNSPDGRAFAGAFMAVYL
ncbi:MAG: hypothetical protein ACRDHZ_23430, partial [Ktedonobacteraceae bacterium]